MVRKRVLSFMSHFSGSPASVTDEPKSIYDSPASTPSTPPNGKIRSSKNRHSVYASDSVGATKSELFNPRGHSRAASSVIQGSPLWVGHDSSPVANSPVSIADHTRSRGRSSSRPLSMIQTYQPPRMDVNADTIPELQPIFTFLNSHANKLYQEGYFLKLDDQNTQGKPNPDRTWTECFAQLVGTVLSLWDAAELDAAGENGEVLPKFLNLTDASIKMIESLPTQSNEEQPLQNILSLSTAGRNRYLLHFNSKQSLIQWTSGIRLAMFEHSTLQEAYTGALIAGKGKSLNNIGVIMERSRVPVEQWVRVRFGAGVPWRRCWCVVCPPDEKEFQKAMKEHKKKNPYDRSHPPTLKGDIKFYDQRKEGKKQKKLQPIATINDAYSAYAIYPQTKTLIDGSTLVKIEGDITIHGDPPSSTEGFVFIMPEVNPGVSGFEMMLRFLFPAWDTFGLYGRPGRLVASVLDSRSLMFAMPMHKHYGYLELLDVSSLISTEGSAGWNEREWRKKLKELTGTRMNTMDESENSNASRTNSRKKRLSFGSPAVATATKPRVGFADEAPPTVRTSRSMSLNSNHGDRTESAPSRDRDIAFPATKGETTGHVQSTSDSDLTGSILPQVPRHGNSAYSSSPGPGRLAATAEGVSSDEERGATPVRDFDGMRRMQTPEPVSQPPTFSHAPGDRPNNRPYHSPEMRRANSRLSLNTLKQLAKAGGVPVGQDAWGPDSERSSDEHKDAVGQNPDQGGPPPVHLHANDTGILANNGSREALMKNSPLSPGYPSDPDSTSQRSRSPFNTAANDSQPDLGGQNLPYRPKTPTSRPGTATGNKPPGPPPHGPPQGSHQGGYRGPPTGPLPGPPGMPPPGRGRGRPPPNMMPHSGRGYSFNAPPGMYPPGSPGPNGRGRPKTPPANRGGPPATLNTSPPLHRKPLPTRSDSLQKRPGFEGATPVAESASSSSSTDNPIDFMGFGQVRAHNASQSHPLPPQPGIRRIETMESQSSSRYDDAASSSSPDYASSRPSTETAASVERPRAGVLRTTGATDDSGVHEPSFDIPGIDFGPTLNYAVAPRSMTSSGGVTQSSTSPPPASYSPATTLSHRPAISDSSHSRKDLEENVRRSVIWQPGGTVAGSSGSNAPVLSAEEFVQQRAAAAATPLYAHQRHSSGITLSGYRTGTPTPPLGRGQAHDYIGTAHSRNSSQDLLQRPNSRGAGDILQRPSSRGAGEMLQRPNSRGAGDLLQRPGSRGAGELLQRPKSRELLQRPGSRGAGAVLGGQQAQGESVLSAREQEHVSRVTGSPLISLAGGKTPQPAGGGLVGAIQARQREKEHMKQGWASQAAQTAIQRQQQHHQQHHQQQMYQQYQPPMPSPGLPPPAGMYSNMGRGMVPPSPRQQGFGMQDAQWAAGPGGFRSPTPGSMDPRYMASQAQLGPSPPFPGGAYGSAGGGRGANPNPYHGQAF